MKVITQNHNGYMSFDHEDPYNLYRNVFSQILNLENNLYTSNFIFSFTYCYSH